MTSQLFPFHVDVHVRGYEIDVFGHVNNAIYLNWLEHARWSMVGKSGVLDPSQDVLAVLRHLTIDFQRETRLGDLVRVSLWPRKVGNSSFTLGGSIHIVTAQEPSRANKLAVLATQVIACVQRGGGKAAVPHAWRQHFPAQDPGEGAPANLTSP